MLNQVIKITPRHFIPWLFLSIFMSSQAHAGRESNGGNPVALDFITNAKYAIAWVNQEPETFPELTHIDLDALLSTAKIVVVDEPLIVRLANGSLQTCAATNTRNPNQIEINKDQWTNDLFSAIAKQELALHELLGLAGLESTGDYTISSRYMNEEGAIDVPSHSASAIDWTYSQVDYLFKNEDDLNLLSDLKGTWKRVYSVANSGPNTKGSLGLPPQTLELTDVNAVGDEQTATLKINQYNKTDLSGLNQQTLVVSQDQIRGYYTLSFSYSDAQTSQQLTVNCQAMIGYFEDETMNANWVLICRKLNRLGAVLSYDLYEPY